MEVPSGVHMAVSPAPFFRQFYITRETDWLFKSVTNLNSLRKLRGIDPDGYSEISHNYLSDVGAISATVRLLLTPYILQIQSKSGFQKLVQ